MKVGKHFTGKHLAKEDLEGKEVTVTIKNAKEEMIGNEEEGREQKVVVYFEEFEKGLVLNVTNFNAIKDACDGSDDDDDWAGVKGTLYVDQNITYAGKRVGGLRLRFSGSNGKITTASVMGLIELMGDIGWKMSEFKKMLKTDFGVDALEKLPADKVEEVAKIINMGPVKDV